MIRSWLFCQRIVELLSRVSMLRDLMFCVSFWMWGLCYLDFLLMIGIWFRSVMGMCLVRVVVQFILVGLVLMMSTWLMFDGVVVEGVVVEDAVVMYLLFCGWSGGCWWVWCWWLLLLGR